MTERLLDLLDKDENEVKPEVVPTEVKKVEGEPEVSKDPDKPKLEETPEGKVEEKPDFEFELDDDPEPEVKPKVQATEALVYKLSKKNRQLQSTKTELEQAKEEIETLKAAQLAPVPIKPEVIPKPQEESLADQYGYPPIPVIYENGINTPADYQTAYMKWEMERRAIDANRVTATTAAETQKTEYKQGMENRLQSLGKDADKFFTDKGIDPERGTDFIANAVNEIDSHSKFDGSLAFLLDAVGEGSAAVAYHLGSKSAKGVAALSKVKALIDADPSGLKAVAFMSNLKRDLTPKVRKAKTDIEPDEALVGGNNSLKASSLQREYDEEQDFSKLRVIMRKAKKLGIELKSS